MQIKPSIGSVVGKTDDAHWGQVFISPHAYGVVEIEDVDSKARQLGVNALAKLSKLLETVPVSLSQARIIADSVVEKSIKTLILLIPVGNVVYLVFRGSGAVYLKRGEQLARLLGESGELSGEVQLHDTILLVSKGFTESLSGKELSQVFDHLSAEEASEKLTLLLHEATGGLGGAGLLFQVQELIPLEAEAVPLKESVVAQPVYEKTDLTPFVGKSFFARLYSREKVTRMSHTVKRLLPDLQGRNKWLALAAVLLIIFFVASVMVGIGKQLSQRESASSVNAVSEAQHAYEEGVALLDLNPVKGRERLTEAKNLLAPLAAVSPKSKFGRQVKMLSQQISDSLSLAMQVVRGEPQLFYDVSLLKKDASILTLAINGDTIAALDKTAKTVFAVSLSSKGGRILAGGNAFQTATLIGIQGDSVYVMTNEGIHLIHMNDKTTVPAKIKTDAEWGTIAALVSFGGNIYLLDTSKSRIWKYVAISSGFSELREYLNPDTLPNLQKATGLAIDGSVWTGTSDGKILRFTQGKEATYVPQGVDPAFGTKLAVYTSDDTNNVYVLDTDKKRVVVLDKDGIYVAQYVWEENLTPAQFVVSEQQKKIFFLIDGKIYALNLK